MKYVLGLTGPTGAGKSTAANLARDNGFFVIDCDKLVKEVYEKSQVLKAIKNAFGEEVFFENFKLNRKKLAEKAFSSKENTELLNKTVLPFILEHIKEEISGCENEKILLDAPTLFESGANTLCNDVCAVLSLEQNRFNRIISRDNITEKDALLRMSAGKKDEYYKARTQHIIYNDAKEEDFKSEFSRLLMKLGGN